MAKCDTRFLCDEMLSRAGRWLRAAGYDVDIAASGEDDRELLLRAQREGRCLITRDRNLFESHEKTNVVSLVQSNTLPEQLAEITARFHIDWLCRPFTRCMECNGVLVVAPAEVVARVPEGALRDDETVLYCPHCDKPYWYGSHVKRMKKRLSQLASGIWQNDADEND